MFSVWTRILVVQLLLLGARSVGQQVDVQEIYGSWRVSAVLCSDCGNRVPAEKGTIIDLEKSKINNPLYQNCEAAPGYAPLKEVASDALINGRGKSWPQTAKRVLRGHGKVLYGVITCDGFNYMQVAFLSANKGFYFFEGDLVFVLAHMNTPARKR